MEDLFYQFVQKLEDLSETDHKTVYIDGTKLESAAGRYTFVWRKPIQKYLAKIKAELEKRTGQESASAIGTRLEEERQRILFVHGSGCEVLLFYTTQEVYTKLGDRGARTES